MRVLCRYSLENGSTAHYSLVAAFSLGRQGRSWGTDFYLQTVWTREYCLFRIVLYCIAQS